EIVAGFHVEYSGIAFALFFLAEYANMILISTLTAVFFFGGWQGPFEGYPRLGDTFLGQPSFLWLLIKVFVLVFFFLWFRATFPRYRYDHIMRLGWKALIPVTLVLIGVEMLLATYRIGPWSRSWFHSLGALMAVNPLKTFLLPELLKGLLVTVRTLFTRMYTLNYPEEKTPQSPRFRGLHALRRYP